MHTTTGWHIMVDKAIHFQPYNCNEIISFDVIFTFFPLKFVNLVVNFFCQDTNLVTEIKII